MSSNLSSSTEAALPKSNVELSEFPFTTDPWQPRIDPEKLAVLRRAGKVPRFDGCSLRDWTKRHDSALPEPPHPLPQMTQSQVQSYLDTHPGELWMVIHGVVYDCSLWQHYHPGGAKILAPCAGKDASVLYDHYHRWVNCESTMGKCAVGVLVSNSLQP